MKEEINNSIYKYKYTKGTRFGIGIYFKNTPGHYGSTYGYCSCNIYFPPGKLKPYAPYVDDDYYYSSSKWHHTFKFCEGIDFTICCAQNSCISESEGPIQKFINLVVNDPFNWDD